MLNPEQIDALREEVESSLREASTIPEVEAIRVSTLGKKGKLTLLMRELKNLEPAEKKVLGANLNATRAEIDSAISKCLAALSSLGIKEKLDSEWIDVSLPASEPLSLSRLGSLHPLTRVQRELERIFTGLGFTVVDGPEVESEYYNFEALNIPDTHPARDMQDTFFMKCGALLRTHTSSMQVRALERTEPPLRIVAPGRCFRCERVDASHEHTFYQMEGMMVDRVISVGHLIYFMKTLLREVFGSEQKIRLRPGYFPFVEPGFELDIWFRGSWLELLPCGLVHPKVLESGGIDPNKWQGFAFGLGLSRLVMSRYQIDDIRHLQAGDARFLEQFS